MANRRTAAKSHTSSDASGVRDASDVEPTGEAQNQVSMGNSRDRARRRHGRGSPRRAPGGRRGAYETTTKCLVNRFQIPVYQAGSRITVKVNPGSL